MKKLREEINFEELYNAIFTRNEIDGEIIVKNAIKAYFRVKSIGAQNTFVVYKDEVVNILNTPKEVRALASDAVRMTIRPSFGDIRVEKHFGLDFGSFFYLNLPDPKGNFPLTYVEEHVDKIRKERGLK